MNKQGYERLSQFRYRLRCFHRVSEDICQAHGLTSLQYQLLLHVMGAPGREGAPIGELAGRLRVMHHGVVALVDRCEKAGLVKRVPGREDRRQVEIHLRPKGRELVEALAVLHQPELQQLREILDRLELD